MKIEETSLKKRLEDYKVWYGVCGVSFEVMRFVLSVVGCEGCVLKIMR